MWAENVSSVSRPLRMVQRRPLRMVQRKPRKAGWAQVLSKLGEMGAGWLAGLGYIVFGLGLVV